MIVNKFIPQWTTFTGSPPEYGDRLSATLDRLEAKLNSIASLTPPSQHQQHPFNLRLGGLPAEAAHPRFEMHGLSLGHDQAQDQPGGTDEMEKLMVTDKVVQQEIAVIKEQMDDTVIDVAGQRFNTKRELQAWSLTHGRMPEEELAKGKTDIHIFFPDALGSPGLAWQEFGEGRGMILKVQTKKAGCASTDDVLFMSSFEGSLLKLFGTTRTDLRVLPDAKTHKIFDSGNPNTSFKSKLAAAVTRQAGYLSSQARASLSYERVPVALDCIETINDVLNWRTDTQIAMKNEHGPGTEVDNWLFISHSVCHL
jgi:hypothetical protein